MVRITQNQNDIDTEASQNKETQINNLNESRIYKLIQKKRKYTTEFSTISEKTKAIIQK